VPWFAGAASRAAWSSILPGVRFFRFVAGFFGLPLTQARSVGRAACSVNGPLDQSNSRMIAGISPGISRAIRPSGPTRAANRRPASACMYTAHAVARNGAAPLATRPVKMPASVSPEPDVASPIVP
jgi:hypothetical protein